MCRIIQFMHPGSEHRYLRNEQIKPKNTGTHERNFIRANGRYVERLEENIAIDGTLCFWGEWENEANAEPLACNDFNELPQHIITPRAIPGNIQPCNTDPFVFGNCFKYFCCKQKRFTSLKNLNHGDIILFGSSKNHNFVLDTVFVVDRAIQYYASSRESYKEIRNALGEEDFNLFNRNSFASIVNPSSGQCSACGNRRTGCCQINNDNNITYTFYTGATFDNPVNRMFSFSPALPVNDPIERGFARVVISPDMLNGISPNLRSIKKIIEINDTSAEWERICRYIIGNGLVLGVQFSLNENR